MIRSSPELTRFEREYSRSRDRTITYEAAARVFEALWDEARALNPAFPSDWKAERVRPGGRPSAERRSAAIGAPSAKVLRGICIRHPIGDAQEILTLYDAIMLVLALFVIGVHAMVLVGES